MSVVLAESPEPGPAGLEQWAQSFLTLARVSGDMAQTAFVPQSLRVYRNDGRDYDSQATAAQVTAAILTGRELGLEPMASLRSIHVINASPALSALALRAIVLGAGHRIWVEEANNTRAAVAGVRAGDTHEQRVTWTMDDARSRGIAGKRNWRTQPRNMLIARATAEVARLVAADAILGVPYVIEELEDEPADETVPAAPPTEPKKTLRRRNKPAPARVSRSQPAIEPAAPTDEPPLDDEPQNTTPKVTDAQKRKLFALFKKAGIEDRGERLAWVNERLDRQVQSSNDLTDIEASQLIEMLQEAAEEAPPATAERNPAAAPPQAGSPQPPPPETLPTEAGTESERILDVSEATVEILTWQRREAGVDDEWMQRALTVLGLEDVPKKVTKKTLQQLSQKQARELQSELNAIIDARQE